MQVDLHEIINNFVPLNNDERNWLDQIVVKQNLEKGKVFLEEGKSVDRIAFITSGILEMYQVDENGVEISLDFLFPGDFATDYISFLEETPCEISIRTIQPSRLLIFSKIDLDSLYEKSMNFQKLGRLLAERSFIHFARNIRESFLPTDERYSRLVKEKPHWIQSIPQYKIASYLHITPEWLSKIRARG